MSTVIIAVGVAEDRPRGKILARGTQGNFLHLHALHRLCRKYGICPTYFLSYPALKSARLDWLSRAKSLNECEVGTFSQSWTTPPFAATENRLTGTPSDHMSRSMVRDKLQVLTELYADRFGGRPLSHMSDGWDFSSNLVSALASNQYRVDCSFAPGVSALGYPSDNPFNAPYFPAPQNPTQRGNAPVLEVPVATSSWFEVLAAQTEILPTRLGGLLSQIFSREWSHTNVLDVLRIEPRRLQFLLELCLSKGATSIVLPINSYDLGIGTSNLASNEREMSDLLQRLDQLFRTIVDTLQMSSMGLESFAHAHMNAVNP